MASHTNTTEREEYFMVGWFKYPKDLDINYDLLQLLYIIIIITSLPLNVIFLAMIIKNPGNKTWTNMSIILASLSIMNLAANGVSTVNEVYKIYEGDQMTLISNNVMTSILAMAFTKYYVSTFLLAFITYAMIVKPLLYKAMSPKPRTMVFIILALWLTAAGVFLILPLFIDDYSDIMQTIVAVFIWLFTFVMAIMYAKILTTLRRRKRELQSTLNVAASRQGLLVIKQNSKLATTLFLYIVSLVLQTLPITTCLFLLINCPPCNKPLTITLILHLLPPALLMSVLFPIHWLFGTPQYYNEIKRLASKLMTFTAVQRGTT
ncbi:---NA--- [Paramuricea clavata]|uniref:---NA n=1 Tax=Paramuricea clavata TaxID=317549 RepID=A0A7D9IAQ3_PARCT|nr:---NA--- [Paramuricea clavata]